jgi:dihydrofolate reductase
MIKSIIVARSINHVIGKGGKLPWHLPADMRHFKKTTYGHHVIMGRKTFESLPGLLPGRKLIVLSHDPDYHAEGCTVVSSLHTALDVAREANETEVFIAGGAAVYREALVGADKIYLTLVHADIQGDTFFPLLENHEWTEINRFSYPADDQHAYAYEFIELARRI